MPEPGRERSASTATDASGALPAAAAKQGLRSRARQVSVQLAIAAVLAAGHLAIVRPGSQLNQGFMWDEFGWVAASDSTFRLMFLDRDGGAERWRQGFQKTTYGAMNPNFAKLVMGFALYCWGYDLEPPAFFPRLGPGHPRYDRLTPAQRTKMGKAHVPYVIRMRWLMLCVSAACAVALYFVGRAISGPVLGIAAYVAFVFTPLVKELSFVVYSDNLLLLMTLLSVLATVGFARWWSKPRSVGSVWRAGGGLLLVRRSSTARSCVLVARCLSPCSGSPADSDITAFGRRRLHWSALQSSPLQCSCGSIRSCTRTFPGGLPGPSSVGTS